MYVCECGVWVCMGIWDDMPILKPIRKFKVAKKILKKNNARELAHSLHPHPQDFFKDFSIKILKLKSCDIGEKINKQINGIGQKVYEST